MLITITGQGTDSPGLVNFAIGLVNSVFNFEEFE